jgi:hypothetical protein
MGGNISKVIYQGLYDSISTDDEFSGYVDQDLETEVKVNLT